MCTLTVVKHNTEIVFTFNRDEDKMRATTPPQFYFLENNKTAYISPKDSVAGGTWIALSDAGIAAFLLNGGKVSHKRKLPYKYSRGKIILDLLASSNPIDFLIHSNYEGVEPFTLITYIDKVLRELIWDGNEVELAIIPLNGIKMWSSATLYSAEDKEGREILINSLPEETFQTKEAIKKWHQQEKNKDGLLYEGFPQVATVSTSQLILDNSLGNFYYDDLLSGSQTSLQLKWREA